ncbi:hypothetical protein ABTE62_18800, partial [Acinetobacter baumannii]
LSLAAAFDVSASRVVAAFSDVEASTVEPRVVLLGPTRQVTPVLPDLPPMTEGSPSVQAPAPQAENPVATADGMTPQPALDVPEDPPSPEPPRSAAP